MSDKYDVLNFKILLFLHGGVPLSLFSIFTFGLRSLCFNQTTRGYL
jgi:hypothetical protein